MQLLLLLLLLLPERPDRRGGRTVFTRFISGPGGTAFTHKILVYCWTLAS
jgi:hypothetical protein